MRIDIRDLELVRSITENGSLAAAANDLHITPSAVSQRVTSMQEKLGDRLFEKRQGLIRLTEAGERLYAAALVITDEVNNAVADIENYVTNRNGRFWIATECYTCYRWLPFVISAMRQKFPEINVDVVPDATDSPREALQDDRIDIAIWSHIGSGARRAKKERRLFSDELYAVMHESNTFANEDYLQPSHFADQVLILYTGVNHVILDEVLTPANVSPRGVIQVRITEAIIELARSGQGIAVIAGWALSDFGNTAGLVAVPITRNGLGRTWYANVNERCDEQHVDWFVSVMRELGSTLRTPAWREKLQSCG